MDMNKCTCGCKSKKWLSLLVENDVGVLAKISGLFSGKSYNLESLTVGPTEDETMSRITLGLKGDERTFEQIQKQLNRCVEVIKVVDITNTPIHIRELMLVRIENCSFQQKEEAIRAAGVFGATVEDYGKSSLLIQSVAKEENNDVLVEKLKALELKIKVVRGGSVAAERV